MQMIQIEVPEEIFLSLKETPEEFYPRGPHGCRRQAL